MLLQLLCAQPGSARTIAAKSHLHRFEDRRRATHCRHSIRGHCRAKQVYLEILLLDPPPIDLHVRGRLTCTLALRLLQHKLPHLVHHVSNAQRVLLFPAHTRPIVARLGEHADARRRALHVRQRRVHDQRLVHVVLLRDARILQLEHLGAVAVLALVHRLGLRDQLLGTFLVLLRLRHRRGRRVHGAVRLENLRPVLLLLSRLELRERRVLRVPQIVSHLRDVVLDDAPLPARATLAALRQAHPLPRPRHLAHERHHLHLGRKAVDARVALLHPPVPEALGRLEVLDREQRALKSEAEAASCMRTSTGGRPQGALPGPVSRLQARVDAGDAIRDSLLAIASAL